MAKKQPSHEMPLPEAPGLDALLPVIRRFGRDSRKLKAVLWSLEQVLRKRPISVRRMAQELHTRPATASKILKPHNAAGFPVSGWMEWASYVTGNGGVWSEATQTPLVREITEGIRETLGRTQPTANSLTTNGLGGNDAAFGNRKESPCEGEDILDF